MLNENLNSYQNTIFTLLNYIKNSKEKLDYFPKIINKIINNINLSQELFDKIIDLILNDLKIDPPFELEFNLDSLSLLTNDVNITKNLIENSEFTSIIISLYKNRENLTSTQRKNITIIYTNLFKNTYNTEIILNKTPEIIQTVITDMVQNNDEVKKEEDNREIIKDELNIITSMLKDQNNVNQLIEKNLITKENINDIINNFESSNEIKTESLNELKKIVEIIKLQENKQDTNAENMEMEENKENEDNKKLNEDKEIKVNEENKDLNENKEIKVNEEIRENEEINKDKENVENKEIEINEDNKEIIEKEKMKVNEENKELKENKENKENVENKEIKENEDNKEITEKEEIKVNEENKELNEDKEKIEKEEIKVNEENKELNEDKEKIEKEEIKVNEENKELNEDKEKLEKEEKKENKEDNDKNSENKKIENNYFQSEREQLNKLEEKINEAYEEHLKILNKPHNREETDINSNDTNELDSISKKRKISFISNILIYNYEKNSKIGSLISTKLNDEILLALDNLISLIRLFYSKNKIEFNEERINLIKQAFDLLKKYTICPYNQKVILETGLISFIEKLNKKEENQIYLIALDVLKNCTYSENAVQIFILSSYYDFFIEEILKFYENIETINENEENKKCFSYYNVILSNIIKFSQGFESLNNKIGIEKILMIGKVSENENVWENIISNLNLKLENQKPNQELNLEQIINDILLICKKVLDKNNEEINENLFIQTLKLLSNINSKSNEDLTKDFDYIKIINSTFDKYKNNYEYMVNIIILLKICLKNKNYCNEIMEFNLIEKISGQIKIIEYKDDLIYNFSDLLYNAIETNENKEKIFSNEIINHVFDLISKYSQKIDDDKKLKQQQKMK